MTEYLIGIIYHEAEAWALWNKGFIEDYESSTGLFIAANSLQEAISWGEKVGESLLRFVNKEDSLNWKELGYYCWHEPNIENSCWAHCKEYFQHVTVGEMPLFEKMTTKSYELWVNKT